MTPGGSSGLLGTIATLMGILGGLLAVIKYFYPEAKDFVAALSENRGILTGILEPISAILLQAADFFIGLGPLASALLLFCSMIAIGLLNELLILDLEDLITIEGPLAVLLLFFPFAVIWFWLFPIAIPGLEMVLFIIGYGVSGILPTGMLFAWDVTQGHV